MTIWHEYFQQNTTIPAWPYPIHYGDEKIEHADVLVLGGGIAGCHAAINARRKDVRVIVLEKAATKWSGNGGAGVDHWLSACTNPCSQVSPEAFTTRAMLDSGDYDCGPLRFINATESWDALLDCEEMGMQIRDINDEFKGAAFRDDDTQLMFAYDYESKYDLRVHGYNVKPCLYKEMKRLGVEIYDRVMVTALLTNESDQGTRVSGAMGLNTRTGEFVIVKAKATILTTGLPGRIWLISTEYRPTFRDPTLAAEGVAMAWQAGAEFTRLEETSPDASPLSYIPYGVGNAHNTWHGCSIIDANGKEVPWVDRDGKELKTIEERFQRSPGQAFTLGSGLRIPPSYENQLTQLAPDLPERIEKGEFVLPLYADLSRLPEHERRAIFGLMVGNEGKTRIPVYDALTKAGFDPDLDMLQVPVMNPSTYQHANFWSGMNVPQWRQWGTGGLVVNWDLRTNLEGLYAAGGAIFGGGAHSSAAASGRYAGRKAATYARVATDIEIDPSQIEVEKSRVYAPLKRSGHSIGWKELNAGICRIMQDYCGLYKTEETLKVGLQLLQEVRNVEASKVSAANPHELAHAVECFSIISAGEAVIQASLARKSSSSWLKFNRLDYPSVDPPEWDKLLVIKQKNDQVTVNKIPKDYHLQFPYAPTYEENYQHHCDL